VDLPQHGSNPFTDGRDGKVDGTDERSAVSMPQHVSAAETTAAASALATPTGDPPLRVWHHGLIAEVVDTILHGVPIDFGPEKHFQYSAASLCAAEEVNAEIQLCLNTFEDNVYNSFDNLLQKMDTAWTENTALREAYHASRDETVALKAAVDALTQKLDQHIAIPAPPSPDLMASSTAMEEMTMQLSVVQHDIQDVLDAVRNPPGKRK
jgi:hypothetical protein